MGPDDGHDLEREKLRRLRRAMYSRSLSPKIRTKPRRDLDPLQAQIPDDWVEEEETVAVSRVAPATAVGIANQLIWWFLGAAVLFFLAAVVAFIYFFTIGSGSLAAAPGNVDIAIQGPLTVTGGEPAEIQIVVTNKNQATLELADLVITYPPGTRSTSDFITDLPRQRISLGSIEPGGQRKGTVSAVFVAPEGSREQVEVELEYRVSDSNAIFVSEDFYELNFSSAPVVVAVEANEEAISGQRVVVTARVSSNSDSVVKDVLLEAEYPFGFEIDTVDPPEEEEGGRFWELGDLSPGEERTIRLSGTLKGQVGDERVFRMITGTRREVELKNIDVQLSESAHTMAIAKPFIDLDIALLDSNNLEPTSLDPGETMSVVVTWENTLSSVIDNAVIVANLDGLAINGATVQTRDGFYRSSDNTILWDKTTTRGILESLTPGERGTVRFSFTVPTEEELLESREQALNIAVHAAGRRTAQTGVPETLQATVEKEIKIASNVQFVVQGFYYANPFGSVGPLPPKVDEETTYALVFTVANTANDMDEVKLEGTLPPYVRWVGVYSPSSERVTFDSNEGTIEWDLGSISAGVGVGSVPPRQIAFAVGFTPSNSQIGQAPALIRSLNLTGIDTFTEERVDRGHRDVDTNLVDDPGFSTTESTVVE